MVSGNEKILKSSKVADDFALLCNRRANDHKTGNTKNISCCGVEHGEFYMHKK